ncbi:MAG: hypothetical protein R2705_19335 [Ilumatobacteraceae bacterium]
MNGFAGVAFSRCDRNDAERVSAALACACGVTSYLPTVPTTEPAAYPDALAVLSDLVTRPPKLGVARSGCITRDRSCHPCGAALIGPSSCCRRTSSWR